MISQPYQITRINRMGKPYVQASDPSLEKEMSTNDMWLNPVAGTIKMWNGTSWMNMQWGESAIMDDCIVNRMIASDISANKITTGVLQSQNGEFVLNLTTGEAKLLRLIMGGEIEGNIIATSSDGLTRVRLRGRDPESDTVTAGIIFEQREEVDDDMDWENAGQINFGFDNHQTYASFDNYSIGKYNSERPTSAYNAGTGDGFVFRAISTDWLKAACATYHGFRLAKRDTTDDTFTDYTPVLTAIGNLMSGTSIVTDGIATCTYCLNDVIRIDFNIKVTTAGSGSASFGISRDLLRQLNSEIPIITPLNGGTVHILDASGSLLGGQICSSLKADGNYWHPARVYNSNLVNVDEASFGVDCILVGTCYGKYAL